MLARMLYHFPARITRMRARSIISSWVSFSILFCLLFVWGVFCFCFLRGFFVFFFRFCFVFLLAYFFLIGFCIIAQACLEHAVV